MVTLDLMVANVDPYYDTAYFRRYRNDPTGFVAVELLPVAIQYGLADWGDLTADGRTDMLVAGNLLDPDGNYRTAIRTHTAQADGSYLQPTLPGPDVPWLDIHVASWRTLIPTTYPVGNRQLCRRQRNSWQIAHLCERWWRNTDRVGSRVASAPIVH